MKNVPIHMDYKGKHLIGGADPIAKKDEVVPLTHSTYLEWKYIGTFTCEKQGWVLDRPANLDLIETLGEYLHARYE